MWGRVLHMTWIFIYLIYLTYFNLISAFEQVSSGYMARYKGQVYYLLFR